MLSLHSEGQSAAIPVASMEFAAICLRNALLLLPEHQQQELKTENSSKNSSQSGSTESGSENSDACRSDTSVRSTYLLQKDSNAFLTRWFQTIFLFFHKVFLFVLYSQHISPVIMFRNCTKESSHNHIMSKFVFTAEFKMHALLLHTEYDSIRHNEIYTHWYPVSL